MSKSISKKEFIKRTSELYSYLNDRNLMIKYSTEHTAKEIFRDLKDILLRGHIMDNRHNMDVVAPPEFKSLRR